MRVVVRTIENYKIVDKELKVPSKGNLRQHIINKLGTPVYTLISIR